MDIPGCGCLDNPLMYLPPCRMLNQQYPVFLLVDQGPVVFLKSLTPNPPALHRHWLFRLLLLEVVECHWLSVVCGHQIPADHFLCGCFFTVLFYDNRLWRPVSVRNSTCTLSSSSTVSLRDKSGLPCLLLEQQGCVCMCVHACVCECDGLMWDRVKHMGSWPEQMSLKLTVTPCPTQWCSCDANTFETNMLTHRIYQC